MNVKWAAPATTGGGDNLPPASAWEPLYECLDLNEALSQILQVISDPPPALIEDSGFGFQLLAIPLDPRRDHHPAPSGDVARVRY